MNIEFKGDLNKTPSSSLLSSDYNIKFKMLNEYKIFKGVDHHHKQQLLMMIIII